MGFLCCNLSAITLMPRSPGKTEVRSTLRQDRPSLFPSLMVLRGLVPVIRPSMWHILSYIMETQPLRAIIKLCSVCLGVKDQKLTGNSVFAMTVLPRGLLPRLIYSPYRQIVTS